MGIPYDAIVEAFLSKVTEFEFFEMPEESRDELIGGYMKRAISEFDKVCKYDLRGNADDEEMEISLDITEAEADEILNILSEGMLVQWLKPYLYRQELLENALSTRDFTVFSPAELQRRVKETYNGAQRDYIQMIREYSYNHGDLSKLHI